MKSTRAVTALPDVLLFGLTGLAWFLHAYFPAVQFITYPLTVVGWVLAAGALLAMFRLLAMQRCMAVSTNAGDAPTNLIVTGAYAHTRNPYYVACVMFLIGVALGFGSLSSFLGPVLYVTAMSALVIPAEETILAKKFGEQYLRYKKQVRRWF